MNPTELFTDSFHRHLDECRQCRENPFGLCVMGLTLLNAVAISERNRNDGLKRLEETARKILGL